MADYFASDIHLRLDRPDRARRFARWVDSLRSDDNLVLVGDVCDFWFAARQQAREPMRCAGLKALANYVGRGGSLRILPGNHDQWLGPFYEANLGATMTAEPFAMTSHGRRLRLVHGHLLGARSGWKARMESREFLAHFGALPHPAAAALEAMLFGVNGLRRGASDRRHLAAYRRYADDLAEPPEILVLGHIHRTLDEARPGGLRMVLLGSWIGPGSFLRIDDAGASLLTDPAAC